MAGDKLNYREVGKRIRRYRRAKGLSQDNLAELIGMSQVHIGHIETGAVKMSLSALINIANALGVSPDVLLSGEAYYSTEALRDEFAELFKGCDAPTLRLMFEICETIKADDKRRRKERID